MQTDCIYNTLSFAGIAKYTHRLLCQDLVLQGARHNLPASMPPECNPQKVEAYILSLMQVSMKLRLAQMWDHNGTNMEALGFMYRDYKIFIALDNDDNVKGERAGSSQRLIRLTAGYNTSEKLFMGAVAALQRICKIIACLGAAHY